jgi:hypothetical protein
MNNRAFEERYTLPDSSTVGITAHSHSFFRNLEYFTPAADGKTLFGQQLTLRGLYRPSPYVTLSGGAFVWKDFGNPALQDIRPVFTVRYQKNHFALLFGTLEGHLNHRQIEPLQDFESVITNRQEEGFQFLYNGPKFWADVWLEWQNSIYRYSKEQEQLQVGVNLMPTLHTSDSDRVQGILQARAFHRGGQLDTSPKKLPGVTFWAVSPGVRFDTYINSNNRVQVDLYIVGTGSSTTLHPKQVRQGIGFYGNIQWKGKFITTMVSYWDGNGIYIPGGGPMYSSLAQEASAQAKGTVFNNRNLLYLRLIHDINLGPKSTLSLRAEPQYDLNLRSLDYNYQMYLNIMPSWHW